MLTYNSSVTVSGIHLRAISLQGMNLNITLLKLLPNLLGPLSYSFAPEKCGSNLTSVFFKVILQTHVFGTACEIGFSWVTQNSIEDQPTLIQVMAWWVRPQAIFWANVDPDLCHHMVSLGHNKLSRASAVLMCWAKQCCGVVGKDLIYRELTFFKCGTILGVGKGHIAHYTCILKNAHTANVGWDILLCKIRAKCRILNAQVANGKQSYGKRKIAHKKVKGWDFLPCRFFTRIISDFSFSTAIMPV